MKDGLWWDKSITLVEGCTPISVGCENCWSAAMAARFKNQPTINGHFNGQIKLREDRLHEIIDRKKPTTWTIWNDLFHKDVNDGFLGDVFEVIRKTPQHTIMILTKRAERMAKVAKMLTDGHGAKYFNHVQWGATICNQPEADEKIPILLQIPAAHRWASVEPILGPIDLTNTEIPNTSSAGFRNYKCSPLHIREGRYEYANLGPIDFVIIGCESGPERRPCKREWIVDLVKQCKAAGVKYMVKQMVLDSEDGVGKVCHDPEKCEKEILRLT